VVELVVGGLCAGAAVTFDALFRAGLAATFVGVVAALAFIDARHRILPNAIVYPASIAFAAAIVAGSLLHADLSLTDALIGAVAFGAPMFVLALASPKGMGMGDVKLAALIGLVLGAFGLRYVAVAAAVGILAGGLGSAIALAAGRSRKSTIPFGPYLALGAIASTFFAPAIARAYG
jgi:leader peptidase (prepilin peptidase)/N-methyltransferase